MDESFILLLKPSLSIFLSFLLCLTYAVVSIGLSFFTIIDLLKLLITFALPIKEVTLFLK
jgi:hypothetical protein